MHGSSRALYLRANHGGCRSKISNLARGGALKGEADRRWHRCSEIGKRGLAHRALAMKRGRGSGGEGGVGHYREAKGTIDASRAAMDGG